MKRRGWAACGLMTLTLTACGSSSTSSTSSSSSASSSSSSAKLTQTQWLAKANAACTTLNADTRALGPHPTPRPGETKAHALDRSAAYLDRLIPLQVGAAAQIRALGTPPQNADLVTQALTAVDVINADLKTAATAARAGNLKQYLAVIRGRVNGPDGNRANATAQKAGLTACAG